MAYKEDEIVREEERSTSSSTGEITEEGIETYYNSNENPIPIQLILTFPLNLNRMHFAKVKIVLKLI